MRCGRAQRLMVAAADAEIVPRRRRALDRHLVGCAACRAEAERTARLLDELAALPSEYAVPAQLEQATLRRVRLLAAEEAEGRTAGRRWWAVLGVPAFALASAAVVVLAVGLYRQTTVPGSAGRPRGAVTRSVPAPAPPPQIVRREREPSVPAVPPPSEPPPELAAAPDLFVDLPILRNMEKLEHFDAISTTTLDDGAQSNG